MNAEPKPEIENDPRASKLTALAWIALTTLITAVLVYGLFSPLPLLGVRIHDVPFWWVQLGYYLVTMIFVLASAVLLFAFDKLYAEA